MRNRKWKWEIETLSWKSIKKQAENQSKKDNCSLLFNKVKPARTILTCNWFQANKSGLAIHFSKILVRMILEISQHDVHTPEIWSCYCLLKNGHAVYLPTAVPAKRCIELPKKTLLHKYIQVLCCKHQVWCSIYGNNLCSI